MSDIPEVSLHIDGQLFKAKKDVLCEHSDYFRAMFSGNYAENDQQVIKIEMVDANSMDIILRYMEIGLIELSEFSLDVLSNLAVAAGFLQMTELIRQIEYCLDFRLSLSNWTEIMSIAENTSYIKLEQLSAAFGLFSFKNMKPEYIPTIQKLFWYLSHPYLDTISELDVFKFGYQWLQHTDMGADAFLLILACLDVKRLTSQHLREISQLMKDYEFSLAAKVVECLKAFTAMNVVISLETLKPNEIELREMFTDTVYNEVYNIVKESKERKLEYTPVVPIWSIKDDRYELTTHYVYRYSQTKGLEKWIEVADKNLWGWSLIGWGPYKMVLVGGENGRGTGMFMRDVRVYDTMRSEWTSHGVSLPARRHAGVTVVGDSLFITGGVGGFRLVLSTAITYDLNQRTFRKMANFPDAMQLPAICTHDGVVYVAGQKNVYKYEESEVSDKWVLVLKTEMRTSRMTSFKDYIYLTQNFFSNLYRFKPGAESLQLVTQFSYPVASICNYGNRILVFTRPVSSGPQSEVVVVEEYTGIEPDLKPKVLKTELGQITINDVAGACLLIMTVPPVHTEISDYHQKHIMRYCNKSDVIGKI